MPQDSRLQEGARASAPRHSFRDVKIQRLENMASDNAVGPAVLSAAKTEERLRREVEQRRIEEQRRSRELAARVKHIEDRRISGLSTLLSELDELDRLRRLIAMLTEEILAEPSPRLSAFLAWIREHLAQHGARLSPQAIEDRFEVERHLAAMTITASCRPGGSKLDGYASPLGGGRVSRSNRRRHSISSC